MFIMLANYKIYRLGYFNNNYVSIKKTYYENNVSASNISDIDATPMTIEKMKSQSFVDELNNNIKSINLEEIDPLLKDYTLVNWKLGEDNYPTLDF